MKTKLFRCCVFLLTIGGALFFSGCGDDNTSSHEDALSGKDYKLELPDGAGKVECKPVTDEQLAKIESKSYQFITKPIYVTKDGEDDVILDQMATVSFSIPEDYPKENYYRLLGVVITKDGPVYMIPNPDGIDRGVVSFETNHFCPVGAVDLDDATRREIFIKRTAANGWQNDLCNADLEKSLKEKMLEAAEDIGLGKNDFLGIAAREVLADNDLVKDVMNLIDGKEPAEMISEKLEAEIKSRTLAYLFGQLQKNPKNMKLKKYLEKHLTTDNVEDWATQLGSGKPAANVARDYIHSFAVGSLKEYATAICPYVKTIQTAAKAMEIIKKFWSSNKMNEMYERYKKHANSDGTMSDDMWNLIIDVREMAAAQSKFGMTSTEIRKMFENRMKNEKDIKKKEREVEKTLLMWENNYWLLQSKAFKNLDYIQRLTQIHKLMERFRKELVRNGDIPNRKASTSVDMLLCEIVAKYLEFHPDHEKFYAWLTKMGYYQNKFQEGMDHLDNERSWWLVRTDISSYDNKIEEKSSDTYTASENTHTYHATNTAEGEYALHDNQWYGPFDITFEATCTTPPETMNAGDSIVLHATIKESGGETGHYKRASSSLCFDKEDVGMGGRYYHCVGRSVNLDGSTEVGSHYGEAKSGEWDYVINIPSGREDELRAINFDACGSRTHWVYRWCTVFEKDDQEEQVDSDK